MTKIAAKAFAGLLIAVAAWGATALADNSLTLSELPGLLLALGTGVGVYYIPNKPPAVQAQAGPAEPGNYRMPGDPGF